MQVDWHKHPHAKMKTISEIEEEIFMAAVDRGVLVSRGSWFTAERADFHPTDMFFRATFAAATEDKMTEAIERFGVAVRMNFGVN
jgi:aromatic amino acid aminotransferase I